jgi:histone-lysine N-methyltransferase SETMAR
MLKPKSTQSSGCTHIRQTSLKILNKRLPARKLIATVFWDRKRSADGGINATRDHINVICVLRNTKKLHRAIQNKRRGMLTYCVVLFHDNAHLHTAARTRALLEHFNWELFGHTPYSPDLAPSDYLFTYLKNWLGSLRFSNDEELMESVKTCLSSQAANFFDTGTQKLIPRYDKCFNSGGDYVEE